ncbi:MAG TPA: phosphatase domain-containing protein [Caldimonas sp.]|jgi:phosphatidate phosphatase APP1|nr:phosphatase domain-containing protein [Caldimonas sp.]HEX2540113.1 phosphatase domain-containing protein [Caldimonas sp.]
MSRLRRLAHRIDNGVDALRLQLRERRMRVGPARVHAHLGFGTSTRLFVSGHVVDGSVGDPADAPATGLLADIRAMARRYVESEIMGAKLTIRHGAAATTAVTDSDGFFAAELPAEPTPGEGLTWRRVTVTLEQVPGSRQAPSDFAAEVMSVPPGTRFGVISDLDDTVMDTGIHDFRRHWRKVIRSDPRLRDTFPGLPELYRALAYDGEGVQRQPIFYVSSASWGFHEPYGRFLELHGIPRGPLFLKDYGLDGEQWFAGEHARHKTRAIERLFDAYPDMPFILVGDSGQDDATIYRDIAAKHAEHVLAVWIRDVSADARRSADIAALIEALSRSGVPAVFDVTLEAAYEQAAKAGWLSLPLG